MKTIDKWLYGQLDGEGKGFLRTAVEKLTWDEEGHEKDFVVITDETERDIWSARIANMFIAIWNWTGGRNRVYF